MKKTAYLCCTFLLLSCTSNTIFEKPKDLIPRDTMSLLIQELMIASSAKYIKNKDLRTKINYVPLIYNKYKIDSLRFQSSNFYYASKIDIYKEIIEDAKNTIDNRIKILSKLERERDSIAKDSLNTSKLPKQEKDTLGITPQFQ